jgi:hypothetical protein
MDIAVRHTDLKVNQIVEESIKLKFEFVDEHQTQSVPESGTMVTRQF